MLMWRSRFGLFIRNLGIRSRGLALGGWGVMSVVKYDWVALFVESWSDKNRNVLLRVRK